MEPANAVVAVINQQFIDCHTQTNLEVLDLETLLVLDIAQKEGSIYLTG